MDAIAKAVDVPYRAKPGGHLVKFNLEDADLAELVNHISGLTGKRFIYGPKVRQIKVTVVSPTPVTLDEAYEAFLSILESNGMTVVPQGRFLKIVDSGGVVNRTTPIYKRGQAVPDSDRFVTRLHRLRNVPAAEAVALLTKFKSKEGDVSAYEPGNLLIITDSGANIRRMSSLIDEVDVGQAQGNKMWIQPVHHGAAADLAKQINELFDVGGGGGGKPGAPGAAATANGLARVVADDQTNSLIVVGDEDAYQRLLELMRRIDVAPSAEGKIHVLPLQHAVAEELSGVLTQMLSGASGKSGAPAGPGASASVFEGEIRVTADKATNSLVVTSSGRDYAQLRLVVEELDMPRRQVFIEAVIMDVSVDRANQLGLAYHGGATASLGGGSDTILLGGFEPLKSIAPGPDQLQGLALGVRGPELAGSAGAIPALPGISIPAFGIVLNALATSGDANVLSTPHIIATDNTEAQIHVGENIPLQQNAAGLGSLGGLAGLAGGQAGAAAGGLGGVGGLGALGMMGGFGNAQRQDVGTKIKVTPHINRESQVRLEIHEEISERGAATGALGAVSITKRTAETTLVVDDQQTVVIGGLMRDSLTKDQRKIPILGDIPILGFLFRSSKSEVRKTNLLLILTPYVILHQNDLRKVFERKMQERQEFLDRYFVFNSDWEPPKDFSRTNGLVESIRQAYIEYAERRRLEIESQPGAQQETVATIPLDLPGSVRTRAAAQAAPGVAPQAAPPGQPGQPPLPPPAAPPVNRKRPRAPQPVPTPQGDASPIQLHPVARSLDVERME